MQLNTTQQLKELPINRENNIDEYHNYVVWKKSDKKRVHTVWVNLYKITERAN